MPAPDPGRAEPAAGRLDVELVRRGMATSRTKARELIDAGQVSADGRTASKASQHISEATLLRVRNGPDYASRGAYKLAGALSDFTALVVAGRRCLDAGASTGGFTDVLLRAQAREVVAVDVGSGQLIERLRLDPRVHVHDRCNVRTLNALDVGGPVDLCVADLSFISLTLVLPALLRCLRPDGDALVMVKPQFEVGRERLGTGGVVRDPRQRIDAVVEVARAAVDQGWGAAGVAPSRLPGPAGNVEYFLWLRRDAPGVVDIAAALR